MSSSTFRGNPISREDVLRALAKFDTAYGDDPNAFDGWMDNGSH